MEYANAAITIGGKIKRSDVERLAQVIADEYVSPDWSDSLDEAKAIEEIETCAKEKHHLRFCRSEQPWGKFEQLEEICEELQLTYVAECEAGGDWSPLLTLRQPEMGTKKAKVPVYRDGQSLIEEQDVAVVREWAIAEIGTGPMITAQEIQNHLDRGTLADELVLMTAAAEFPWPIEIIEAPDLTAVTREIAEGGQ
jgi:hypothetical protein